MAGKVSIYIYYNDMVIHQLISLLQITLNAVLNDLYAHAYTMGVSTFIELISSTGKLEEQCQELSSPSWSALVSQISVATAKLGIGNTSQVVPKHFMACYASKD